MLTHAKLKPLWFGLTRALMGGHCSAEGQLVQLCLFGPVLLVDLVVGFALLAPVHGLLALFGLLMPASMRAPDGMGICDVLQGHVVSVSSAGIAYLQANGTQCYALARNLDATRFDQLQIGQPVSFRANRRNGVVEVVS